MMTFFRTCIVFKHNEKDLRDEVSEPLTNIPSSMNSKLMEENQHGQRKKYSIFEGLRDCIKQMSLAFMVYR